MKANLPITNLLTACFLLLLLFSCSGTKLSKKDNSKVKVSNNFGTNLNPFTGDTVDYIAFPFAFTDFTKSNKSLTCILGKDLKKGLNLKVHYLGSYTFNCTNDERSILIALPEDPEFQTIRANTFLDFSIKYPSVMRIVESWFLNAQGFGKCKIGNWENESSLIKFLETGSD